MLIHYTLTLRPNRECKPTAQWAYHLYGALMEMVPPAFGTAVHQNGLTPVRQFLEQAEDMLIWHISLFGQEASHVLCPILSSQKSFILQKPRVTFEVIQMQHITISEEQWLFSQKDGLHHLVFHTPTCFKSQKQYQSLPTPRLLLQSLIASWNMAFPNCPICDEDGEGLDALAKGLVFTNFSLHHRSFFLKGHPIHGCIGSLTVENQLTGFHRQLANGLLTFSSYTGLGIKTTLGMGGVTHDFLP